MKDVQQLLQDMLESIRAIESYTVSSYEAFLADEKTQDAIMFNLIIMGDTVPGMGRTQSTRWTRLQNITYWL
jgi:uncharacterized protein with HEPN domain